VTSSDTNSWGEVIETASAHNKFKKGDRIVVPFNINRGECRQCKLGNYSVCQRSNRNAAMASVRFGYTTAGLFGYAHLTGGYAGGQAEYVRVPMADVAPMKVPDGMTDEDVLFLTDIFPTGYQAAEQAGIKGDRSTDLADGPPSFPRRFRAACSSGTDD
jgi:threonine dehydrogenase-like Zn-dependent dehydrogenase